MEYCPFCTNPGQYREDEEHRCHKCRRRFTLSPLMRCQNQRGRRRPATSGLRSMTKDWQVEAVRQDSSHVLIEFTSTDDGLYLRTGHEFCVVYQPFWFFKGHKKKLLINHTLGRSWRIAGY